MPSINRRSPQATVIQPKTTSFNEDRGVSFMPQPVTSVSRPLTIEESWALYFFEKHAQVCDDCRDPYEVYRRGRQLCFKGHSLAQGVAVHVYDGADGYHYSTVKDGLQLVRVEIPKGFHHVLSLLRAVERSMRPKRREPIIAKEQSRQVNSRQLDRPRTVRVEQPVKPSRSHRHSVHYPEIVDWPSQSVRHVVDTDVTAPRSGQDPVYVRNVREKAERRRSYRPHDIEVREPTRRRENRRSGFWG